MATTIQTCGKFFIVSINLFLLIIAVSIIAFGFILKYGSSLLSGYTDPIIELINNSADKALGDTVEGEEFDVELLFGPFAVILLVIGFILFTVALLGIVGACCEVKCMLAMYTILIGVIFVAQLTFVIMFFRFNSTLKNAVRIPMEKLLEDYHGINGSDASSISLNFLMIEFECCGIDGYEDFKDSDWFGGVAGDSSDWLMPIACCKELPETATFTCAKSLDRTLNNYDKGCLDEMWNKLFSDIYWIIAVVGILLLQLMLLVFSIVLLSKKTGSNKVGPTKRRPSRPTQW